ncbi:hypothetical protein [Moraxella lacunata]
MGVNWFGKVISDFIYKTCVKIERIALLSHFYEKKLQILAT